MHTTHFSLTHTHAHTQPTSLSYTHPHTHSHTHIYTQPPSAEGPPHAVSRSLERKSLLGRNTRSAGPCPDPTAANGGRGARRREGPPQTPTSVWVPAVESRPGGPALRVRGPVPADPQVRLPWPLSPRLRTPTAPTRRPSTFRAGLCCPRCRRSDAGPSLGYEGDGGACRPGDVARRHRQPGARS